MKSSYILRSDSDSGEFPATVIYSPFLPREGENVVCPDGTTRFVTLIEHNGDNVTVYVDE